VLSDRLEAIANNIAATYNIAATAQIQPSMSEPADVSLPLPSSDLLLMDTKTAAVSTVVIDDKTIKPSSTTSLRRRRSSPPLCPSLPMAQIQPPQPPVVQALLAHRCTAVFDAANWDKL